MAPAGNILVALEGTHLQITGDTQNNGVEISAGSSVNEVVLRGLDGTHLNGLATPLVLAVTGGLAGLDCDLKSGNDQVVVTQRSESDAHWPYPPAISNLVVSQDVTIRGGRGDDIVLFRNVSVGGNLNVQAGLGNDVVVLEGVTVAGNLTGDLSRGNDSLLLRASSITGTSTILSGSGKDAVGFLDSTFTGASAVNLRGFLSENSGSESVSVENDTFNGALALKGGTADKITANLAAINTLNGIFTSTGVQQTLERVSGVHFEYEGEDGPEHWGDLTPAFLLTSVGRQQTPLAIDTTKVVHTALPALDIAYQANTNLANLLPTNHAYYAYSGSLTTPPGTEGVSFALFTQPISLSAAQIQAITTASGLENNRPIQPTNDRVVFVSN